ncbi:hypothetical protein ACED16_25410 [Enterobacter hormaechei]
MKLIDILVRELPERGGWPESASTATQDSDGEICFSSGGKHEYCITSWKGGKWTGDGFMAEHAIDYEISIISREQYESALAASKEMTINKPDSDGWISWCGGECPVDGDMVVDVRFRAQGQADLDGDVADNFRWEHFSNGADIVAYRLHKPEHQKPEWDGEGLPKVGTEAEVSVDGGRTWCSYKATSEHNGMRLVEIGNFTEEFQRNNWMFRPIRSEADKKKEAVEKAIADALLKDGDFDYAEALRLSTFVYVAISRNEIPHIRID